MVVLVTGASSGIGAAVARGFGAAGARVAIHHHTGGDRGAALVRDLATAGVEARAFGADLSRRGSGDRLIAAVLRHFGTLDILVNNAGSLIRRVPSVEVDDQYFDAVVQTNLYSTVACCRAAARHMVGRGRGTIVNVSSIAARTGGGVGGAVLYGAVKAAVATYTRGLAKELAPAGVRVNAISPGVVATPFHDRFTGPEALGRVVATIPVGRAAQADEIVGPVLFLASNALSAHVVGQVLEINGGMLSP
jgi:3-oxoacyl-[acyl-carrier protein] reductase